MVSTVLVTGAAGFIGYHMCARLLADGKAVVGIDTFNDYYDPALKKARHDLLEGHAGYTGVRGNVCDQALLADLFKRHNITRVVHLAAQAGVRYSIDQPMAYADANLTGFLAILEACRAAQVMHLVYASSSSVYGVDAPVPFSEDDKADRPVSLYAATKRANELMAHTYAHLYGVPCTGLRYFTVYGPWGRPDMAPMLFADCIVNGRALKMFNRGDMSRDFTYIDDVVDGTLKTLARPPAEGDEPLHAVYNIGQGKPVRLPDFIATLEDALGRKAIIETAPMQPGDVQRTWASTEKLQAATGYVPRTSLADGIREFARWYLAHQAA